MTSKDILIIKNANRIINQGGKCEGILCNECLFFTTQCGYIYTARVNIVQQRLLEQYTPGELAEVLL